ncbi:hypothetical protein [Bradyrhizobium vignae]|uniref:Uncharacterized protein n=1 Tax=Bradyrhizobium vignae TaxID=1549949 RepID=A0A2U3PUJ9_9BRAD|nr:hypothetical protein [Bradyrhizobium vignae]SPP92837.1 protein of unknown function [Bradyrhizobium vignae]
MYLTVPFECRYEVEFIPYRCRKPRKAYFQEKTASLILNQADPSDAKPAFRITNTTVIGRRRFSEDILAWKEQLWWPLKWSSGSEEHVTEAELLGELAHLDEDVFRQHMRRRVLEPPLPKRNEFPVQKLISDEFEATLEECQRKALSYLMICDGFAYVAGGEPLYVLSKYGVHFVAAAGPDRAARPRNQWIHCDLKTFDDPLEPLFSADSFEEVKKLLPRKYRRHRVPRIDVLEPRAIQISQSTIRCDILFRCLVNDVTYSDHFHPNEARLPASYPGAAEFRERLFKAAECPLDNDELTRLRVGLLRECLWFKPVQGSLRAGIEEFLTEPDVARMSEELDPGDEAALASLA